MKNNLLALMVALSLGSGTALATNVYTTAPGDTWSPADGEGAAYVGTVQKSGGSFVDKYYIDFTKYTKVDEWSFQVLATSISFNGNLLTGLTGLSMALYDGTGANIWTMPLSGTATNYLVPGGTLSVNVMTATNAALYSPGTYRFDVMGSGQGAYSLTATIPEPETWAIFLTGIALLGLRLRNRQKMLG